MNPPEQEYSLTASAKRWTAREYHREIVLPCCGARHTELKPTDNEKTREFSDGNITEQGYSFSATAGKGD